MIFDSEKILVIFFISSSENTLDPARGKVLVVLPGDIQDAADVRPTTYNSSHAILETMV